MISGRYYADKCKWVECSRYPDRPRYSKSDAKAGDWVFLNGDRVFEFTTLIMPRHNFMQRKHVFVVHNSDQAFDSIRLAALLPFALSIHAANTTVTHPILTTIPLGFPDQAVPFTLSYIRPNLERDIEIYANFTISTNMGKRNECLAAFAGDPRVVIHTGLDRREYYEDLCRSKYVLCPEGTGIDTHRFYEAVFCGATPVVLRNSLSDFYSRYPVKIIDKWSDL